jgi:hypothetical protein
MQNNVRLHKWLRALEARLIREIFVEGVAFGPTLKDGHDIDR